jgi:hypothetical protein
VHSYCARPASLSADVLVPAGHPGHRHSIAARMVRTDTDLVEEESGELHQMHARLSSEPEAVVRAALGNRAQLIVHLWPLRHD